MEEIRIKELLTELEKGKMENMRVDELLMKIKQQKMEEIRNDELLIELHKVTERWEQILNELDTKKELPATYYLKAPEFAKYMSVGRQTAQKIAMDARARVWIGNVQMINIVKVHEYLDSINE